MHCVVTLLQRIEHFESNNVKSMTIQAQNVWRVLAVALFFGLLIFFGVLSGFLALLDRTPRLTATSTLFLWIWTGFVLFLGAGALHPLPTCTCLLGPLPYMTA